MTPSQKRRAERAAEELAAATERMNLSIRQAEVDIRDLGLGVAAFVELKDGRRLYFSKKALRVGNDDEPDTPLLNCSRATRLEALASLPRLMDALIDESETQAKNIHQASASLEEYLTALETEPAPPPDPER